MDDLQHIIKQKRELLSRDTFSRAAFDSSEGMSENQKDRYISYLVDRVNEMDLDKRAMELVLEDFLKAKKEMQEELSVMKKRQEQLDSKLDTETKKRKKAEQRVEQMENQLAFARKNQFGDKRQKVKNANEDESNGENPDRNDEQEKFDGTDDTLETKSVPEPSDAPVSKKETKRDLCNRPDTYNAMGLQGDPVEHPSDDSKIPGRILDRKMVKVFHFETRLVEEHFEMIHYVEKGKKPKWGYFPKAGHPAMVTKFEGTKATPEFLQALAYEVYVKNVTFGLLHQWLLDLGMTVSANTLRNWLKQGKKHLDRLVVLLKEIALEKDSIVNCDETWCKVRKYDAYKKCYIWVLVNKAEQTVIFFYEDGSRGRDVLVHFLGDAELKSIMTDGYNAYVFIGDELKSATLKNTEHQVCMAHTKAKFVKAEDSGGDHEAHVFNVCFGGLYGLEHQYDKEGLIPDERYRRRQGLETKEIQITLRQHLSIQLEKLKTEPENVSSYLKEAVNYLEKFWDEIFAYLKDGNYPIDNNIAERSIRKLTTQRNSMLHFGSDEGVEMAATYHSVISTVKMHGKSAWEFLGKFFTNIFNGCRDYLSLSPKNIGLALCQ